MTSQEFLDKVKSLGYGGATSDEYYTPADVYDTVVMLFHEITKGKYKNAEIVRPFYPGGDYLHFDYPPNCVVIDNPPFSILGDICKFYNAVGIKYMLFGPALTIFSKESTGFVTVKGDTIYAEGQKEQNVLTGFRSNCWHGIYYIPTLQPKEKKASNRVRTRKLDNGLADDCHTGRIIHTLAKQQGRENIPTYYQYDWQQTRPNKRLRHNFFGNAKHIVGEPQDCGFSRELTERITNKII